MTDHCTLEYKLAVDFSCQQISGSGGRYYFPLNFCPLFHQKIFLNSCKYLYPCKKSWGIQKDGSQEAAGAGNVKKQQKRQKIM